MLIYLAARYGRREELCATRAILERMGHQITSRWLSGLHEIAQRDNGYDQVGTVDDSRQFACEDVVDVKAADCLIAFTEPSRSTSSRGGRHVELGLALAWEKRVIVIGHRENVFCCLPQVEFYPTLHECLAVLAEAQTPTRTRQGIPHADPSTYALEYYPVLPPDQTCLTPEQIAAIPDEWPAESPTLLVEPGVHIWVPFVAGVVHRGQTLCYGLPSDTRLWPSGHSWVLLAGRDQATCSRCRMAAQSILVAETRTKQLSAGEHGASPPGGVSFDAPARSLNLEASRAIPDGLGKNDLAAPPATRAGWCLPCRQYHDTTKPQCGSAYQFVSASAWDAAMELIEMADHQQKQLKRQAQYLREEVVPRGGESLEDTAKTDHCGPGHKEELEGEHILTVWEWLQAQYGAGFDAERWGVALDKAQIPAHGCYMDWQDGLQRAATFLRQEG